MLESRITRREASRLIAFGGLGCVWSNGCVSSRTEPPTPITSATEAFERILELSRAKHKLPGLAAAVVCGDKIAASGVTGVRRHGTSDKLDRDDRFHIASCTKSMTAMLAAIAIHNGQLKWTTSLADALPELAEKVQPEYRAATMNNFSHTRRRCRPILSSVQNGKSSCIRSRERPQSSDWRSSRKC